MTKKNLIVGQSGGPTAVINSSLYGVVSEGIAHSDEIGEVYGMVNGIGTSEELLKTNAIYREVYESQVKGGEDNE